ncbi:hypothetical protein [Wolbachia endosymbiont of Cantharis cryptica]|uniref:hypothetical protein n=1 Tax=Wolbachia endosymbiont of Cantharis cryptica TaxID=3066132 RepID=UPI00376ED253
MSTLDKEGWEHIEKHECNTRENINIFFYNTLASLSRSWKDFKIDVYVTMYEIGT